MAYWLLLPRHSAAYCCPKSSLEMDLQGNWGRVKGRLGETTGGDEEVGRWQPGGGGLAKEGGGQAEPRRRTGSGRLGGWRRRGKEEVGRDMGESGPQGNRTLPSLLTRRRLGFEEG
ncbi:unnamed protein product [Linum trigynum]|uniref:Uncharacterized protein n=1 Tax=Linum trigynum TaxID=586398 RepID=A0AAV2E2X4_9ROSI